MTFEYYPVAKSGKYCSNCVENERWQEPPDPVTGEDNPLWNGGKVELTCPVCGEAFERYPSNVTDGTNLCSNECRSAWLSETYTGDGHPNWQGGGNEPYGKGWARVRKKALERDDYRCVICGTTSAELGRNPDVHHIVAVRAFIDSDDHRKANAHTLDNVVSLCIDCHRKAEFGHLSTATLRAAIDTGPEPDGK
ncbi:MAG: HNH endonuclease [Halobacteriales archaeon]|nr:HNH endonuclease [Halobacteriales archaeon]